MKSAMKLFLHQMSAKIGFRKWCDYVTQLSSLFMTQIGLYYIGHFYFYQIGYVFAFVHLFVREKG